MDQTAIDKAKELCRRAGKNPDLVVSVKGRALRMAWQDFLEAAKAELQQQRP